MSEIRERLKDLSSEHLSSEQQRFLDDAQERVGQFYELSRDFVRENQTAVILGVGAFIGLIGFFLGRASKGD